MYIWWILKLSKFLNPAVNIRSSNSIAVGLYLLQAATGKQLYDCKITVHGLWPKAIT